MTLVVLIDLEPAGFSFWSMVFLRIKRENQTRKKTISVRSTYRSNSDKFVSFCLERKNKPHIFSLNIQSIRATFDEFQILLNELKLKKFEFSAICFQETWLMDEADLSLLQLPYTIISQSTICSSHGGLTIYLHDTFNYTLLPIDNVQQYGRVYL